MELHRAEGLPDSDNHTRSVLPIGAAFVFAPDWSDNAVCSILLSKILQCYKGQIVAHNLLSGKKKKTLPQ